MHTSHYSRLEKPTIPLTHTRYEMLVEVTPGDITAVKWLEMSSNVYHCGIPNNVSRTGHQPAAAKPPLATRSTAVAGCAVFLDFFF